MYVESFLWKTTFNFVFPTTLNVQLEGRLTSKGTFNSTSWHIELTRNPITWVHRTKLLLNWWTPMIIIWLVVSQHTKKHKSILIGWDGVSCRFDWLTKVWQIFPNAQCSSIQIYPWSSKVLFTLYFILHLKCSFSFVRFKGTNQNF